MEKFFGAFAPTILATIVVCGVPSDFDGAALPEVDASSDLSFEAERARQLDDALTATLSTREERFRIVAQLEAGSITLDEAIEKFLPLNKHDAGSWGYLVSTYPDRTPEELVGYQLVVSAYARPRSRGPNEVAFIKALAHRLGERFGDRVVLPANLEELVK